MHYSVKGLYIVIQSQNTNNIVDFYNNYSVKG